MIMQQSYTPPAAPQSTTGGQQFIRSFRVILTGRVADFSDRRRLPNVDCRLRFVPD
ncbi:MAG: hypothetical protein HY057_06875 [Rhodospirillales bacterium]|nr:hypothetical protein [Rhodospirillales bacterium]